MFGPLKDTCTATFRLLELASLGLAYCSLSYLQKRYLVDAYDVHGASVVAAEVILRFLFGALFPLAGSPPYRSLGLGWVKPVPGFITAAFVPVLL